MNRCIGDGTLAPARYAVPADAAVFHWVGNPAVTPCSALACSGCGASVRWIDRARFDGDADELEALHDLPDPLASPSVTAPVGESRLYFCRCDALDCTTSMGLFLRWDLPHLGMPTSWSCGGHPPLQLPADIGGETIPADVHWGRLLTATFRQPIDPEDTHRWPLWVEEVYGRLAGTPHQAALLSVVANLLISDDDLLCSRAVRFLWSGQSPGGTDLLLGLVDGLGDTLRGRPDPLDDGDLYRTTLRAVATNLDRGRWTYAEPLVTRVREEAASPGGLLGLLWFLADHDEEWLRDNRDALLEASPDAAGEWQELVGG